MREEQILYLNKLFGLSPLALREDKPAAIVLSRKRYKNGRVELTWHKEAKLYSISLWFVIYDERPRTYVSRFGFTPELMGLTEDFICRDLLEKSFMSLFREKAKITIMLRNEKR